MEELYVLTKKKQRALEDLGMNYVCIWEHEWARMKTRTDVASVLSTLDLKPCLDPRESFFGGR